MSIPSGNEGDPPAVLSLCRYHYERELKEWGLRRFMEKYNRQSGTGVDDKPRVADWEAELDPPEPVDNHLSFNSEEELELLMSLRGLDSSMEDYAARPGYEHLKERGIDLEQARLTDKQLMAVCLVFYGGVKKNRAARAMKITSQALSDHVKAALRKIEECLR